MLEFRGSEDGKSFSPLSSRRKAAEDAEVYTLKID
jgi:hypothetical protein